MGELIKRVVDLAIKVQQIPAPTFEEGRRAEFVHRSFKAANFEQVSLDAIGNVYGMLRGSGSTAAPPLIVSAHLDTVFPKKTELAARREAGKVYGPGIGDNSLGVAGLLGLAWSLRERQISPTGDVWLVANVGEEGLGDLRGMKAVVDRFGAGVQAYLVLEGLALGHVYHRAVGVRRYRVTARTQGGHSWSDYGQQPSAIHELARLVVQLSQFELPGQPRTTMNVGKISGGTSVNVIAPEAHFDLDLRSEGEASLVRLVEAAEDLFRSANKAGVRVEAEVIGQRPAGVMEADHPLVKLAADCLRSQGLQPSLISGSTDANVPMSRGYPAIVLGISTGGGAHTVNEYINTAPIAQGLEQLACLVSRIWD